MLRRKNQGRSLGFARDDMERGSPPDLDPLGRFNREPERSEGSGGRSSPHPGEPDGGRVSETPRTAEATWRSRRALKIQQLATQIVSRPKGGRRFALREPEYPATCRIRRRAVS